MNNSKLSISLFAFVAILFTIGVIPYETQNAFADADHGVKDSSPDRPRDNLGSGGNSGGGNNGGGNNGGGNNGGGNNGGGNNGGGNNGGGNNGGGNNGGTSNSVSGNGEGDRTAPTLGVTSSEYRLVSNRFTYNGHSIDVERFFTPYPLITVNVSETNKAEFKIYDNQGPEYIKHFSFAFGLDADQIISESKAMIELDIDLFDVETVTVTDPENALDDVRVETSTVSCNDDSYFQCLGVTIFYKFRTSLDFNIVATDVWDDKRNAQQNYYNHGIEVVGESLNPPKEYDEINRGHIYHLTETSKTTAVDEFDNSWSLKSGQWIMDYIPNKKILDLAMNGYPREHVLFNMYKYGQHLLAETTLNEICSICADESFAEIDNVFSYENISSLDSEKLQMNKLIEFKNAQNTMAHLLDPLLYRK